MHHLFKLIMCSILILITGCTSYNSYVQEKRQQAVCKEACHARMRVCTQTCYNSCQLCSARANFSAEMDYDKYKQQQRIQGEPVIRSLKSYRDSLQCRKTTCECTVDHNVCLQACTHKLPKRLQVAPVC